MDPSSPRSRTKSLLLSALIALLILAIAFYFVRVHRGDASSARAQLLALTPPDAAVLLFADAKELRTSPFLAQFRDWVPNSAIDPDYALFVQATNFHYERDLERALYCIVPRDKILLHLAVIDGRFDRAKIETYAAHTGRVEKRGNKTVYVLTPQETGKPLYLNFLNDSRIALTDDPAYPFPTEPGSDTSAQREWREHFDRVAGVPLFALLRQDTSIIDELLKQAPGGIRSPQLALLLRQLQWTTMSAKPDGQILRVVVEGQLNNDNSTRQLAEFLSGLLLLAQAGLDDPKVRKEMNPQARDAYLDLLKNAKVEKYDRGDSKAVRLVFEVTPAVLDLAKAATHATSPAPAATTPAAKQ